MKPCGSTMVAPQSRRALIGVDSSFAEAALLNCSLLLTSDEHLRGIDFERLTFELQAFDLPTPVIATPREIVRRFFR